MVDTYVFGRDEESLRVFLPVSDFVGAGRGKQRVDPASKRPTDQRPIDSLETYRYSWEMCRSAGRCVARLRMGRAGQSRRVCQ